jgi:rare lipoprotein A
MKRNYCAKLCLANSFAGKVLMIVTLFCLSSGVFAQTYKGKASYYAQPFHGRKSASGRIYNMYEYTCAHKTLPFGTKLKVTNQANGKTVTVEVTDRGPYVKGRIVDLSKAAAMDLDMMKAGVADVEVEIIKDEKTSKSSATLILSEPELLKEFKSEVPGADVTTKWASTVR